MTIEENELTTPTEAEIERDQLRKFLQFEPDPGPGAYAWCCWCQFSHPIDKPHVEETERNLRIESYGAIRAENRGLQAEIERLACGDFTDVTINLLVDQYKKMQEQLQRYRENIGRMRARIAELGCGMPADCVDEDFQDAIWIIQDARDKRKERFLKLGSQEVKENPDTPVK